MKAFWTLMQEKLGENFAHDRVLQNRVLKLSQSFTAGRENLDLNYLTDLNEQRAYLAYFLPLNYEKVRALLTSHSTSLWAKPFETPQHWIDLGCGPGTAVIGALAALRERHKKHEFPLIQIDLVDNQKQALTLAQDWISAFAEKIKIKVKIRTFSSLDELSPGGDEKIEPRYDLALAANVLNELPPESGPEARETLLLLWKLTKNVLFVLEPGHRVSSQRLVRFRQRLLKTSKDNAKIIGPCAHTEECPVYRTQHWCHFSEPVDEPRLIELNLKVFKNPRHWLKFSYLLVAKGEELIWDKQSYRAIGDLHPSGPKTLAIDLCQPVEKFVLRLPAKMPTDVQEKIVRGAMIKLEGTKIISARTLTPPVQRQKMDPAGPLSRASGAEVKKKKT